MSSEKESQVFHSAVSQEYESASPRESAVSHGYEDASLQRQSIPTTNNSNLDNLPPSTIMPTPFLKPSMDISKIDRMESILERLVLISSDQTLNFHQASNQAVAVSQEIERLQLQLIDLKAEIVASKEFQQSIITTTSSDIVMLRKEISLLREQITGQNGKI
jgi:hypothetical protein